MRLPKGAGSVVKLSGNRRRPYCARKTVGYTEKGYQKFLIVGYFETYLEGLGALMKYNANPYDIETDNITFEKLYERWLVLKSHKLNKGSQKCCRVAYSHSKNLYKMKYKDIKAYHMQSVIDNCGLGYASQSNIKTLLGHLDKFALELEVITRMSSELVTTESAPPTSKTAFTEEIARLWEHADEPWVDTVLIFLYTGFRISELCNMPLENIDFNEWTFKGGIKSAAGKNRIVPIHERIRPLVQRRVAENNNYFLENSKHNALSDVTYRETWKKIMQAHGMKYTPHEARHTLVSRLQRAGANQVYIDRIVGHASQGTGQKVYTHVNISDLHNTIGLVT